MPEYVLNRPFVLAGLGHMIHFEKGVPTWVPPELEVEAVKMGAEPVSGVKPDPLPPEVEPVVVPEGAAREEILRVAFDEIDAAGVRGEITAQGIPTVKAVEKRVGFDVTKTEIDSLYRDHKAEK